MNNLPETKFSPDVLYASYKQARNCLRKYNPDSVLAHAIGALHKAAHGGYEVMRYYQPWNISTGVKSFGTSKNFLLVVTYDSLNLGSNTQFVNMFGQKVVDGLQSKYGNPLPIPIENVFFLEIDDLERLLARVCEKQTTIVAALLHAQKNDSDPATQKFSFIQHLESLSPQLRRLPRLQSAFETLFNNCTALLKNEK